MDGALNEDEVLMIFDDLEVQNSPLKISFSWRRLFLKVSLSTSGRRQIFRLRYVSRTSTLADCN